MRLTAVIVSSCFSIVMLQAHAQAPVEPPPAAAIGSSLTSRGEIDGMTREMVERLNDPEKRAALREELRVRMQQRNAGFANFAGVDVAAEARLSELQADQELERMDLRMSSGRLLSARENWKDAADLHNRSIAQQRTLLGPTGFGAWIAFQDSFPERNQVAEFERTLPAAERLSASARQQFVIILRHQRELAQEQFLAPNEGLDAHPGRSADAKASLRTQLRVARMDRDALMPARAEAERALSQLLTAGQFKAYVERNRTLGELAQRSEANLMQRFGVTAAEIAAPEPDEAGRPKMLRGNVKFDLVAEVDGSSPLISHVQAANATIVEVELSPGLKVAFTPILFDDGWFNVKFRFLEDRGGARSVDLGGGGRGILLKQPEGWQRSMEITKEAVTGIHGYAIKLEIRDVQPAQ